MKTNNQLPVIDLRPGSDHQETCDLLICVRDHLMREYRISKPKATLMAADALFRCALGGIDFLHGSGMETKQVFAIAVDLAVQDAKDAKGRTTIDEYKLGPLYRIITAGLTSTKDSDNKTALQ